MPATISATPVHSRGSSRSFRKTTEKSARRQSPKARTGCTMDTGALAIAAKKNSQPAIVTPIPPSQIGERRKAPKTSRCRSVSSRRGMRSAPIFCITMPTW